MGRRNLAEVKYLWYATMITVICSGVPSKSARCALHTLKLFMLLEAFSISLENITYFLVGFAGNNNLFSLQKLSEKQAT